MIQGAGSRRLLEIRETVAKPRKMAARYCQMTLKLMEDKPRINQETIR